MDIKHREVVEWLESVYGEKQVPPYEKTDRSISILHQLMTASKFSESNAKTLTDDFANKASEYSSEARQIRKWLDPVTIKPSMLSEEGQMSLIALAHTAQVLDVQVPTSTNIILAINELEMNCMQVQAERRQEQARTCRLLEMNQDLTHKLEQIKEIQQQAEASWAQQQEEHAKNTKQEVFMKRKCNNYLSDISCYEARLNQVGMTKNVTHQALMKQWRELQEMEKQVSNLETQLKSYTLAPDLALAQVEVEAARQELASIMDNVAAACKQTGAS